MSAAVALAPVRVRPQISGNRAATFASILLTDIFALLLAGLVTAFVRSLLDSRLGIVQVWLSTPTLLALLGSFGLMGLYPGIGVNPVEEMRRILNATTVGYLFLISLSFALGQDLLRSRWSVLLAWATVAVFVTVGRNTARSIFCRKAWWGVPVVVLGHGRTAERVVQILRKHQSLGLKPVAILDDNIHRQGAIVAGVPVVGPYCDAGAICLEQQVCYAIVAIPDLRGPQVASFLRANLQCYKHVLVVPDCFGMSSLWVSAKDFGGVLGLEISHTLVHSGPRLVKRAFDLLIGVSLLMVSLPLLALIYAWIKIASPGPVIYGQPRVGRDGRLFTAWKFRSMVVNADDVLEGYLAKHPEMRQEWDRSQKLRRDPRITTVGRILRKTSLDELPQIWNVICGEMSLVGPRPIMVNQIRMYGDQMDLYHKVRPGITGMWQISGRNHTSFQDRVGHDEYYIQNWSIWLDLYILGRTAKTVLFTEGAY